MVNDRYKPKNLDRGRDGQLGTDFAVLTATEIAKRIASPLHAQTCPNHAYLNDERQELLETSKSAIYSQVNRTDQWFPESKGLSTLQWDF